MDLELKGIRKKFGKDEAVKGVSFKIEEGQLTALLGPSGSGKTTVLKMIAGLESPDSGEIFIDGNPVVRVRPNERQVGFVFQNYALFRHMTVYENIAFGLKSRKYKKDSIRNKVYELIKLINLEGLENRYPAELSGGQKQRVAFARSIAVEPKVLLLDEPFAALDIRVRKELRQWLRETIHQLGITSIFVTHDQAEAVEVSDRVVVMNEGKVEQHGKPFEVYQRPATKFVASFIGESVEVRDFNKFKGFKSLNYPGAIVRTEFVEAFKDDNIHFEKLKKAAESGVITDIVFRGNSYEVLLDVKGTCLKTYRSLERRSIEIGERMNVIIYRMYLYDEDGHIVSVENAELNENAMNNYMYHDDGYFVG